MAVKRQKKYQAIHLTIHEGKLDCSSCGQLQLEVLERGAVIYIYYSNTDIYIGQTVQFLERHKQHLKETKLDYKEFSDVAVLFGRYVDKNSMDDLERLFITYLIADNEKRAPKRRKTIHNSTKGNRVIEYPTQKDVHTKVFAEFWRNELTELGVVHTSGLGKLRQSILFKYSPFSALSPQQADFVGQAMAGHQSYLIVGCAGTGKTVVLTNLVARLTETYGTKLKIGVVVKTNWRKSAQRIFDAYSVGDHVTVGSAYQIIKADKSYDIIVVDEAHRLRWNYPKQYRVTCDIFKGRAPHENELFLLGKLAKRLVLLYDNLQVIRPSDIPRTDFEGYVREHNFKVLELSKQFRIQVPEGFDYTADDYINGIKSVLQLDRQPYNKQVFQDGSQNAYFGIVGSIAELFDYVDSRRDFYPTSQNRVIAGYARPWASKKTVNGKKRTRPDWVEGENEWYWNATNENWIARKGSEEEIGSIHAIQGMDLDYAGLIVAKDLSYRDGKVVAVKENYFDEYGKPLAKDFDADELTAYIKNIYYTLLTRGIKGIRIYIEDTALRDYFMEEVGLQ